MGLTILPYYISGTMIPIQNQLRVSKKYLKNYVCVMGTVTNILGTNPFCSITAKAGLESVFWIFTFSVTQWVKTSLTDSIIFRIAQMMGTDPSIYTMPIVITTIPANIEVK